MKEKRQFIIEKLQIVKEHMKQYRKYYLIAAGLSVLLLAGYLIYSAATGYNGEQITFVQWLQTEVPDSDLVAKVDFRFEHNVTLNQTCDIYFYQSERKERNDCIARISDLHCIDYDVVDTDIEKKDWDGFYQKSSFLIGTIILVGMGVFAISLNIWVIYLIWKGEHKKDPRNTKKTTTDRMLLIFFCPLLCSMLLFHAEPVFADSSQTLLQRLAQLEEDGLPEGWAGFQVRYQDTGKISVDTYLS